MAENSYYEKITVAGNELVDTIKRLIADGSVRRIVIRDEKGKEMLSVPMNLGVGIGAVTVFAAPVLAAVGAVGALLAKATIDVERTDIAPGESGSVDSSAEGGAACSGESCCESTASPSRASAAPSAPDAPALGTTSYSSGMPGAQESNAPAGERDQQDSSAN